MNEMKEEDSKSDYTNRESNDEIYLDMMIPNKFMNNSNEVPWEASFGPKRNRILIVDDESFNIIGVKIVLRAAARKIGRPELLIDELCDEAMNGHLAMEKVEDLYKRHNENYGLVITDLSMPIWDGYVLSNKIRSFYSEHMVKQPMIIACSGHTEEEYI